MFAEDIGLLPNGCSGACSKGAQRDPAEFETLCRSLFGAMQTGGRLGFERVDWFNGGLFDDDTALPLTQDDIELALEAADMDWRRSTPRSWARCSSAASTRTSAASSAPTTPTPRRS